MAQQSATMKARPLDKDEVVLLLDFISKQDILTTKATNATNNRLKDVAWKTISEEFSAHLGETRRPEQLRLKWENLKKAARKRSAAIRQNNLKTGGGKLYIPPDDVLDRVASMLGATCSGFTVEFGGDREEHVIQTDEAAEATLPADLQPEPTHIKDANVFLVTGDCSTNCGVGRSGGGTLISAPNYTPKTLIFNTPNNSLNKRRKLAEEGLKAEKEKNMALAAYFRAKTEKVELENIKLKYEIEILKKST